MPTIGDNNESVIWNPGDTKGKNHSGVLVPLQQTGPAPYAQDIKLLGPLSLSHDTSDITTGVALSTLNTGQLILDIKVFIEEEWDASVSIEFGLGLITDSTDYVALGQTSLLDAASQPVIDGLISVEATDEGIAWGFATDTRRALVAVANTAPGLTGEISIYALIAEPSNI